MAMTPDPVSASRVPFGRLNRILPQGPASGPSHQDADADTVNHILHQPLQTPVFDGQPLHRHDQSQIDEWKGKPVVQGSLSRQGEPDGVFLTFLRRGDLHIRRQHRIGGCQHRRQHDGACGCQPAHENPE